MGKRFTSCYRGIEGPYRVNVKVGYYSDGQKCWRNLDGIIDTGASRTSISEHIASEIGLVPVREDVYHTSGGDTIGYIYRSDMMIEDTIYVESFEFGSIKDSLLGVQALIGIDILNQCDFAVTHADGNTKFTIEWPASRDIDFCK